MMVIIDTNVLIDVLQDDPDWADWSTTRLYDLSKIHELVINPLIYAELSIAFSTIEALDAAVENLQLRVLELSRPVSFLAGKAFVQYRRQQSRGRIHILPDFFIGAQAAVLECPLLTRDARHYTHYFPTVEIIAPVPPAH